ncbi:hypothetical protein ACWJJH_06930 [Endozoicomonadaceae bacterium StTr2]
MPIERSHSAPSSVNVPPVNTHSGETTQASGSFNSSLVTSSSGATKQVPEHSRSELPDTPVHKRRIRLPKFIRSILNGIKSLYHRIRGHSPSVDHVVHAASMATLDPLKVSTNVRKLDSLDSSAPLSNANIAPDEKYFKALEQEKTSTREEDSAPTQPKRKRDQAADLLLKNKAIEKARAMGALVHTHYYGKIYPKTGLPSELLDKYHNPTLIIVKGSEANPFGHALIGFEDPVTKEHHYSQINNLRGHPEHMNEAECARYLKEEAGEILLQYRPELKKGNDTETTSQLHDHINKTAQEKWTWSGTKHNCYSYCLDMLDAGGYDTNDLRGIGLMRLPKTALGVAAAGQRPPPGSVQG